MKIIEKVIFICVVIIFFINNIAYSIECQNLKIDIPEEFTELSNYLYQFGDKTIYITYEEKDNSDYSELEIYTENNLNDYINTFKDAAISEYKNELRNVLQESYEEASDEMIESVLKEFEDSFKIDSSKIVNIGVDNYKAFKIEMSANGVYEEQYAFCSKTGSYYVTIASSDKTFFSTTEYLNMIYSIEISDPLPKINLDWKPSQDDDSNSQLNTNFDWDKVEIAIPVLTFILVAVITVICNAVKGGKDKKARKDIIICEESQLPSTDKDQLKEESDSPSKKDITDAVEVDKNNKDENNKRFCTSCGKEMEADWKFCKFCGHKNEDDT